MQCSRQPYRATETEIARYDIVASGKTFHKFKTDPTTRQMTVRICIVIAFGIEYGYRLRQFIIGNVMVANDKINPPFFGISHFLDGLDPQSSATTNVKPLSAA